MRPVRIHIVLALCALWPATVARAQTSQDPPHIPNFGRIFPQPTGVNGYEELVMAGDLLYGNTALDVAQAQGATLTAKRHALADPDIRKALDLLRTGLDKKIVSVRPTFDANTLLPEYSSLRALARLLNIEQYVLLADGEVDGAIQSMRDGLRLGMAARTDHIFISELVGIAIDSIAILQIGRHLDQLSEHDCDSLSRVLEERLVAQPTARASLMRERDTMLQELERARKDPRSVITAWVNQTEDAPETAQMVASLSANSTLVNQAVDGAEEMIRQQFDTMLNNLQLPPWQRSDVRIPNGKTFAEELVQILSPSYGALLDRFTMNNVQINLLLLHVAIRKYRWQYDHPPDRLEQLRLDSSLTLDPFTGKPLVYRRQGDQYEIFSEGPDDRDENGERIPGQHKPIFTKQ